MKYNKIPLKFSTLILFIGPFNLNNSKGQINKINVENFSGIDGGYTIVDKDGKKIEEYNKYNGTFYIKLNR